MAEQQQGLKNTPREEADIPQDAIDALLADTSADDDLVSSGDIDRMLDTASSDGRTPPPDVDDELITLEDIQGAMNSTTENTTTTDDVVTQANTDKLPEQAEREENERNTASTEGQAATAPSPENTSAPASEDEGKKENTPPSQKNLGLTESNLSETKAFLAEHSVVFKGLPEAQQDVAAQDVKLLQNSDGDALLYSKEPWMVQIFPANPAHKDALTEVATESLRASGAFPEELEAKVTEGSAFGLNGMFIPYMSQNIGSRSTATTPEAVEETAPAQDGRDADSEGSTAATAQGFPDLKLASLDLRKAFFGMHSSIFNGLSEEQQDMAAQDTELYIFGTVNDANAFLYDPKTKAVRIFNPHASTDVIDSMKKRAEEDLLAAGVAREDMRISEIKHQQLENMFLNYGVQAAGERAKASADNMRNKASETSPAPAPQAQTETDTKDSDDRIHMVPVTETAQKIVLLSKNSAAFRALSKDQQQAFAVRLNIVEARTSNGLSGILINPVETTRQYIFSDDSTNQIQNTLKSDFGTIPLSAGDEALRTKLEGGEKFIHPLSNLDKLVKNAAGKLPPSQPKAAPTQPAEAQQASTGNAHEPVHLLSDADKLKAISHNAWALWQTTLGEGDKKRLWDSTNFYRTSRVQNNGSFILNPKGSLGMIIVANNDLDKQVLFAEAVKLQRKKGLATKDIGQHLFTYRNLEDALRSHLNVLKHGQQEASLGTQTGHDPEQENVQRRTFNLRGVVNSALGLPRKIVTNKTVRALAVPATIVIIGATFSIAAAVATMDRLGFKAGLAVTAVGAGITAIPLAKKMLSSSKEEEPSQEKPRRRVLGRLANVAKSKFGVPLRVLTSKKMLTVGLPFAVSMGVGMSAHAAFGLAAGTLCAATPIGLAILGGAFAGAAVNLVTQYTFGRKPLRANQSRNFIVRCCRVLRTGFVGALKGGITAGVVFTAPAALIGAAMATIGATTGILSTYGFNRQAYREAGVRKIIRTGAISGLIGGTIGMLMGGSEAHTATLNADGTTPQVDASTHGANWMSQFVDKSSAYLQDQAHIAHERGQELGNQLVTLKDQVFSFFASDAQAATPAQDTGGVFEHWKNFLDSGKEQLEIAKDRYSEFSTQVNDFWHKHTDGWLGSHENTAPAQPADAPKVHEVKAPEAPAHQTPETKAPEAPAHQAPEAKTPEAPAHKAPETPEAKAPEAKAPEAKAPEAKAPEAPAQQTPKATPPVTPAHDALGFKSDLISEDVAEQLRNAKTPEQVFHICKEESAKLFTHYGNAQHMAAGKELLDHGIMIAEGSGIDPAHNTTLQQIYRDRGFIDLHNLDGDGVPPTTEPKPIIEDLQKSGNVGGYAEKASQYMKQMKMKTYGWSGPTPS